MLLYGPPGVGKTTAARLVLEMASATLHSISTDAPFVGADGSTLRWIRDYQPLLGSVHDPIYQGCRDLAEGGIPEQSLVSDRVWGVLFWMRLVSRLPATNKLLKVLEDKRVEFDLLISIPGRADAQICESL